ncbi:tyrosine-type recombinase/integrase [Clostridium gasigenes]|uniref:Tyrosine-type recombinase/integrase n=1 Tax=Clostridium gasigenes TaxID=94869 RepID=A0A7X0SFT3_9CLOT|nr:tyrosine-type recombinase/integrase [Clostridium gasigenes]MBB6716833.1 tyrosine-type recombinase/integrase [Clostridium gasigenes]
MKNLQEINNSKKSKYDEIIEYLKQDNGYWLENDKWDFYSNFEYDLDFAKGKKYLDFNTISNEKLILELKYSLLFGVKNKYFQPIYIISAFQAFLRKIEKYNTENNIESIINIDVNRFKLFLMNIENLTESTTNCYTKYIISFKHILIDFYDEREEVEKDIWYYKKIQGVKIPASDNRGTLNSIDFRVIPEFYRDIVKRYLISFITKRSVSHCQNVYKTIKVFFNIFYKLGYKDGFLKELTRYDIEKYLYTVSNEYKDKNVTYVNKFISYPRTFLEYIQMAQYKEAPKKEASLLIFEDDIPKRERDSDRLKRVKFIPEPILKQLDNNIMDLDRPQFIPIYILLRETGWRGTDILNLRYHNCLEQIWNNKDKDYNYYLCGEITKTGIAELKIPIRDKVAEMIQKTINKTKELSTEENNPNKFLFNIYEGKLKGRPLLKGSLLATVKRLIEEKDIRDINGELYHFKSHSLRHTRAKEYVEQGMGISVIQQILGHRSLQMTVHYATVSENVLYEKWRDTEDLELFKVDIVTNKLIEVDTSTDTGENLIRYEYVKKNLDAVRVPFGVCFKASKLPCKQQMNHCLTCASFCTTTENIPEYEEEIQKVKSQIEISDKFGRELWAEKNKGYLELLQKTLDKVIEHKLVHKNAKSREDS